MKKTREFKQELGEAIRKFCKHQGLPFGSEIQVRRLAGKGRQVRADLMIRRKKFGTQLNGEANVAAAMAKFLSSFEEPNFRADGCVAIFVAPHEGEVHGNTLLRKVRGWEGVPTPEEIEITDAEVEMDIQIEAQSLSRHLEERFEMSGMSEEMYCRAIIRAIRSFEDNDLISVLQDAVKKEL